MNAESNIFPFECYQGNDQIAFEDEPTNDLGNENNFSNQNAFKKIEASQQNNVQLGVDNYSLQIQIPKNDLPKFLNSIINLIDKYSIDFNQPNDINVNNVNGNAKNELKKKYSKNKSHSKKEEKIEKKTHQMFSQDEDQLLKNIVAIFGPKNWRLIASMVPNKTSRQCRDRYMNYLAPGLVHSDWSIEEDNLLIEKYNEFGSCWTKIQQYFPCRTANAIKNRYNYTIRKMEKSMNNHEGNKINNNDLQLDLIDEESQFEKYDNQFQVYENNQNEEIQNFFDSNFDF